MVDIGGQADEGWGSVVDAFRRNFVLGELGAACCVYRDGRPVVDVWGGLADRRTQRPWQDDTIVLVFSTTKGATAICAHMLAERGQLDLDSPVVDYWPEFGTQGKATTLVRWLLSHRAGLPGIDVPLTLAQACAWEPVIGALQNQRALWQPGKKQSYHALTYGFLVGEVVRRATGATLGSFFANEIASPLNLNAWIGLPEQEEERVAHLTLDPTSLDPEAIVDATLAQVPDAIPIPVSARETLIELWSRPDTADRLGGAFPPGFVTDEGGHNARIVRASEHPGSGMVSDARSLARMYAATIGEVDGVRLLQPKTVERMCVPQPAPAHGVPAELEEFVADAFPLNIASGVARPTPLQPLLGPRSFGHGGAGGSLAFADPDRNLGFAYVMNRMVPASQRANNLVAAVDHSHG